MHATFTKKSTTYSFSHRNNNNNKFISALQMYKIDLKTTFLIVRKVITKGNGSLK